MAANIAIGVATTVLPYIAQGVVGWVGNATKTWVPAAIANHTIESAGMAGAKMFGGNGTLLGRIGGAAGRAFGWAAAPYAAQAPQIQNTVNIGGTLAATAAGALINVVGGLLINKLKGQPQEKPVTEQFCENREALQIKMQMEMLEQMKVQRAFIEKHLADLNPAANPPIAAA